MKNTKHQTSNTKYPTPQEGNGDSSAGWELRDEPAKNEGGRHPFDYEAVRWSLSPHPVPLPWGEGEPFSPRRTIQTCWLSTARCALFPLPKWSCRTWTGGTSG